MTGGLGRPQRPDRNLAQAQESGRGRGVGRIGGDSFQNLAFVITGDGQDDQAGLEQRALVEIEVPADPPANRQDETEDEVPIIAPGDGYIIEKNVTPARR